MAVIQKLFNFAKTKITWQNQNQNLVETQECPVLQASQKEAADTAVEVK